ncbi:hypothetical protein RGL42_002684 [Vibrio parahaemolyticus]|nr:hypothetical protein [Vibrio parahaemolyticus]ELA8111163.1 hypothetical protein [Vibrio parahaemolyticus]ELA8164895.1 hypothetical protein [Vibrio parahaemolyticus]
MRSLSINIINHELLTKAYGKWPSFHDAEVLSIGLSRQVGSELSSEARVVVNCFTTKTVNEGTVDFETVLDKNYAITFLFRGISNLYIDGFNHQNVIDDIEIDRQGEIFKVVFVSIFGVSSSFTCREIEVVSVRPMSDTQA